MASFGHTKVHSVNEPDAHTHTHGWTESAGKHQNSIPALQLDGKNVQMWGVLKKGEKKVPYGYVNEVKNSIFIPGGL